MFVIRSIIYDKSSGVFHNMNFGYTASGNTQVTPHFRDMDEYVRTAFRSLFDFGLKIKDRNVFWVFIAKDIETKQYGFTVMLGEKTIIDYQTKGIYKDE